MKSLYGQLMAITSVLLAVAVVLSLAVAFLINAINAGSDTNHRLLAEVPVAASYLRRGGLDAATHAAFTRAAKAVRGGVGVYASSGVAAYRTGVVAPAAMIRQGLADVDLAYRPSTVRTFSVGSRTYDVVLYPVYVVHDRTLVLLVLTARVGPVFPTLRQVLPVLVAVALSLLLAQVLWSLVIRRLTVPLGAITDWAGRLAQGDLRARLRGAEGVQELEALAAALQRMAGALAAEQDRREAFLADVAHDLRTPLSVQRTLFMSLARQEGDSAEVPRLARQAQSETERLIRLVNGLLDMARLEAGQDLTTREAFDLREPVAMAATAFEVLARRRDLQFAVDLGPRPVMVIADTDRVAQIATNLIDNAMRHAGEHGTVRVETRLEPDGHHATLAVTDSGPGVAEADRDAMWGRFAGADRDEARGPSGLGLSIARALARAMGGDLTLNAGLPTRFVLTLPTAERGSPATRTDLP